LERAKFPGKKEERRQGAGENKTWPGTTIPEEKPTLKSRGKAGSQSRNKTRGERTWSGNQSISGKIRKSTVAYLERRKIRRVEKEGEELPTR